MLLFMLQALYVFSVWNDLQLANVGVVWKSNGLPESIGVADGESKATRGMLLCGAGLQPNTKHETLPDAMIGYSVSVIDVDVFIF